MVSLICFNIFHHKWGTVTRSITSHVSWDYKSTRISRHKVQSICQKNHRTWNEHRRVQRYIYMHLPEIHIWGQRLTPTVRTSIRHTTPHYSGVIMGAMASQITSLAIVYSTVYSGADQRKHQSSASLAFVQGIHRSPVVSPHKGPVTRKMFSFDDVIMRQVIPTNARKHPRYRIYGHLTSKLPPVTQPHWRGLWCTISASKQFLT